jgi:hypothetical protein
MTSRWIIAVLDTFSDMPCPRTYRLAAEQIRNFSLGVRLGYSMAIQHAHDPTLAEEPQRLLKAVEIWDGINHFNYAVGDTYLNLIRRTRNSLAGMPDLYEAWKVLLARMTLHPPFRTAFLNAERSAETFRREVLASTPPDGPYDTHLDPE